MLVPFTAETVPKTPGILFIIIRPLPLNPRLPWLAALLFVWAKADEAKAKLATMPVINNNEEYFCLSYFIAIYKGIRSTSNPALVNT